MSCFVNRCLTPIFLMAVVLFATSAQAVDYLWNATPASGVINAAGNWTPAGPPNNGTADTATFGTSSITALTQSAAFLVGNTTFSVGASGYTFGTIASPTNFDFTLGSATAATRRTLTNNSINTQAFNSGTGILRLNGQIAGTGDLIINGSVSPGNNINSSSAYLNMQNAGKVYFNVDSGIIAGGNSSAAAWQATNGGGRGVVYFKGAGDVYLGNLGTAYRGNFVLDGDASNGGPNGQNVILTHNNSLGNGTTNNAKLDIGWTGNAGGNGTLQLGMLATGQGSLPNGTAIPNISVSRFTINLAPRSGANVDDPHIRNASGNNTISATSDWNTLSGATAGNWNIQSDAGTLTIAGGNIYNTVDVPVNLQLSGAGNGLISAPLQKWQANSTLQIVKKGSGTWTLTNANNFDDANTHPFDGNTTVQQGTLALSGAGSLANAPSIDVRSGAFLNVSAVTGGVYTLNSSNLLLKGAGTVTGSLTAGTSNTIAPGDSGIGTLNVSSALVLNGGGALTMELTGTPTNLGGVNDLITVGGNLTLAGSTALNVTPVNGTLGAGTYRLFNYVGTLTGTGSNLALNLANTPRQTFTPAVDTLLKQVNLVVTGGAANLTWVGGVNGDIWVDGQTEPNSINWTGATDNHFYNNDSVTFGNGGTTTVNVSGTVNPGNVNFTNNAGHDYTIGGGSIVGSNLNVSGSGNVTIANGNFTITGSPAYPGRKATGSCHRPARYGAALW